VPTSPRSAKLTESDTSDAEYQEDMEDESGTEITTDLKYHRRTMLRFHLGEKKSF